MNSPSLTYGFDSHILQHIYSLFRFLGFIFYGGIAQFGRASDLHSEGRRFEPDYLHQSDVMIRVSS